MANLKWMNRSNQQLKWLVVVNGQLQADKVDPGGDFSMADPGVSWAGWAAAGFSGVVVSRSGSDGATSCVAFDSNMTDAQMLDVLKKA